MNDLHGKMIALNCFCGANLGVNLAYVRAPSSVRHLPDGSHLFEWPLAAESHGEPSANVDPQNDPNSGRKPASDDLSAPSARLDGDTTNNTATETGAHRRRACCEGDAAADCPWPDCCDECGEDWPCRAALVDESKRKTERIYDLEGQLARVTAERDQARQQLIDFEDLSAGRMSRTETYGGM